MAKPRKKPARSFYCKRCDRRIRYKPGWSPGASVRNHYWRRHPEVMRTEGGE